ncbi:sigma-70 family RNA polymerase sigma factor [Streptomyces sp. NPDC055059]
MDENASLSERFEKDRIRLRAVAYRMLGSVTEADDAVQETWLRLSRTADAHAHHEDGEGRGDGDAPAGIENLTGWLTTVVSRVCLNMLRARENRREDPLDAYVPDPDAAPEDGRDPEEEALLADSVGVALLVVLDTLTPAERLAFVLHDTFAVPFDEIGPLIERTPAATRQLASRARRRVRGVAPAPGADLPRRRQVVEAFLAATRGGNFDALVALLHPDVVLHADRTVVPTSEPVVVRGAATVARGAMAATGRALFTGPALIDGSAGLVMAPGGRLFLVLVFTVTGDLITGIDVIAEPESLRHLDIAVLDGDPSDPYGE